MAIAMLAQAAFSAVQGARQNSMANRIKPVNPVYKPSQYAIDQYNLTRQMFGGRMAGASAREQSIYGQQANATAQVGRNATSGSQALSLTGAIQGQTDQQLNELQVAEQQDKYNRLGDMNNANQVMIGEGDKVYNNMLNQYREDMAAKAALRQAGMTNIYNGMSATVGAGMNMGDINFGGNGNFNGRPARINTSLAPVRGTPNTARVMLPTAPSSFTPAYQTPMIGWNQFNRK